MFHITFVQIASFDWLTGHIKGKFLKKIFKILLRDSKENEAETWHTCKEHCPLQKLLFISVG